MRTQNCLLAVRWLVLGALIVPLLGACGDETGKLGGTVTADAVADGDAAGNSDATVTTDAAVTADAAAGTDAAATTDITATTDASADAATDAVASTDASADAGTDAAATTDASADATTDAAASTDVTAGTDAVAGSDAESTTDAAFDAETDAVALTDAEADGGDDAQGDAPADSDAADPDTTDPDSADAQPDVDLCVALTETCDGQDNDCDGLTDEDLPTELTACGVGACAAFGEVACVDGKVANTCEPLPAADSDLTCDGVDDDCNGQTDDGYQPAQTSCGTGPCAATGSTVCSEGQELDTCAALPPEATDTSCDGVDNNCDGQTDEGYVPQATACGIGACTAAGMTSCLAGQEQDSCTEGTPAANDTSCDGVDNNCNGQTDEGFAGAATQCGEGTCASTGATFCKDGKIQDSCEAGDPAKSDANCNDLDDNCNGQTDEGFANPPTTCGTGACAAAGVQTCVAGKLKDSCVPGAAAPNDTSCNQIDEDCNGETDEDYPVSVTNCGTGACAATGFWVCASGSIKDTCAPKPAAADDQSCDKVDNDCNGQTDEDYPNPVTSCGQGACAATGVQTCVAGQLQDSCAPKPAAMNDFSCNNVDDDCNGATDDGYPNPPSSCGIGACTTTGFWTCEAGQVKDACLALPPAASDTTCDAADDDCDGQTDEDYPNPPSTCGIGACAATGIKTCSGGLMFDSCKELTPAADDQTCNSIDDDCNGQTDEDYTPVPTSCGQGVCTATGELICVQGQTQDTCVVLEPDEVTETSCDNLDNDCDGKTDGADSDIDVGECCAGNQGQLGVDPERACPPGWFCDQSWDTAEGKGSEYERKCYAFGLVEQGECSPYDCGKDDGFATVLGRNLTYNWCEIFKDLTVLGVGADHINAACGWSTNGVFASNAPRSGNGLSSSAGEFDGGYCSCNPICEIYTGSSLPCCKNLFASGANSLTSTYGGFNCGKTHIDPTSLPAFADPHYVGARCRHNVECLGAMTCTQPGTFQDGVPVPASSDGYCF